MRIFKCFLLSLLFCSHLHAGNKGIVYLKLENGKYGVAGADEEGIYRISGLELNEDQIPHSGPIRGPRIFYREDLEGKKISDNYVPEILYMRRADKILAGVWMDDFILIFDDLKPESLAHIPKEAIVDQTENAGVPRVSLLKIKTPYSFVPVLAAKGVQTRRPG